MFNRRQFLATAGALAAAQAVRLQAGDKPAGSPFRVLYSNDTTNTVSCVSPWHAKKAPFSDALLEATVDEVADRGVDVHLLQPGLGWIPWWKSKLYPADAHYRWFKERTGFDADSYGQYMLAGGDMLPPFIARCRKRGQSPFVSLRMNDAHHLEYVDTKERSAVWASRFYYEHPEYRLSTELKYGKPVLDWAVPAVREHKLAFIREICENYDIDGLEMDFMRFYSYFRPGQTKSDQRRSIMTGFAREVRAVLDQTARGGRRRWLCARVPCYVEGLDTLGFDPAGLNAAGVDMLNVSASYFTVQQTDLAKICKQAPKALVYLELCHSIWNGSKPVGVKGYDSFPFRRATPEQMCTAAHLAYRRGAAGVSLFNFAYYREHGGPDRGPFCEPPFDVLKRLGDREWLSRQPQHYILTQAWGNPFTKRPGLPRIMKAGQSADFVLDLAPPANGWRQGGRLRIQNEGSLQGTAWTAKLNGETLTACDDVSEPYPNPYPTMLGTADNLRAWRVPAGVLRDGENRLEFVLSAGEPVRLGYIDLGVA